MPKPAERGIAAFRNPGGKVVGMGVLVDDRHVVTCAHVVNAALGRPLEAADEPQIDVDVAFPLADAAQPLRASLMVWEPIRTPPDRQPAAIEDIAVVRLLGDAPPQVGRANMVRGVDATDHTFRAFGFPSGSDTGNWAKGEILGGVAGEWVQIDGVQTGVFVQPGFSGGAVFVDELQQVLGIVVAANTGAERVAYLIPTEVLNRAWNGLPAEEASATQGLALQSTEAPTRAVVIEMLGQLTPADFGSLRTALPECRGQVDADGAVLRRVQQLVDWAEGATGPQNGLDAVVAEARRLWGAGFFG